MILGVVKLNKRFKIYFICLSIFCFTVALMRSINMGITCDEAITYLTYINKNWLLNLQLIANNHLLNTILIQIIVSVTKIKYNEFILRIPNLIIYLIYLYYSYKISTKLYKNSYSLATVLLLNYSVNEFASVARGYGMASSFVLAALYYYKLYIKSNDSKQFKLAVYSLLLACFSNTICLIISFIFIADFLIRNIKNKNLKKFIIQNQVFTILSYFFFLIFFFYHIFVYLNDKFINYAYCSKDIFSCLIYSKFNYYGLGFINKYIVGVLFLLFVILLIISVSKKYKKDNLFYMSFALYFVLMILKYVLKFNFPTGRTMIPVFSIYIISLFDGIDLIFGKKSKYLVAIIMIFPFISFFKNLNIYYIREWKDDYYLKNRVEKVLKQSKKINPKTVPKISKPTLNYYYSKYKDKYSYNILSDVIYED